MPNKKIFLANNVSNGSADKFRRVNGRVWNLERNGSSYIRDSDSKQKYSVKSTNATYYQDDELTKEMTFSLNIDYEKAFYKFGKMLISLDGKHTTQNVNSISANILFIIEL